MPGFIDHAARSARPRPFRSRWMAPTPSRVVVSSVAIDQVSSVLALSAMVMVATNGNDVSR